MSLRVPEVSIMRLPISLPCPVPVVPGTPEVLRGGQPIPMEERTERCGVDACYMLGSQVICDIHLKIALDLLGIDYALAQSELADNPEYDLPDSVLLANWREHEAIPWASRHRYPQDTIQPKEDPPHAAK